MCPVGAEDFLALAVGARGRGRKAGILGKAAERQGEQARPCVLVSATPREEKLKPSKRHSHPLPTPVHYSVGRVRERRPDHSLLPPPVVNTCLSVPSSAWAPLVPRKPLSPSAPSSGPAKMGSASSTPPSPGFSRAPQDVLPTPLPSTQGTHPTWRGTQTSLPKIQGARGPQAPALSPCHHLQATGTWWAGSGPDNSELRTAASPGRQYGLWHSVASRRCVV